MESRFYVAAGHVLGLSTRGLWDGPKCQASGGVGELGVSPPFPVSRSLPHAIGFPQQDCNSRAGLLTPFLQQLSGRSCLAWAVAVPRAILAPARVRRPSFGLSNPRTLSIHVSAFPPRAPLRSSPVCFSCKLEALQILKYNPGRICFAEDYLARKEVTWGAGAGGAGGRF